MRALVLVLLILLSGAATAHGPRVDERPYAAAGLASTCAPPIPPPPANVNDICFRLQPGETAWVLRMRDAQLAPVGARLTQIVTTTTGTLYTPTPICGESHDNATWGANVVRIQLNVDLGTPGECARATAGVLRLEAYHAD